MKRNFLFLMFLFTASIVNSQSFDKNSSWAIATTNMFDDTFFEVSTYKMDGDTLIGGKSYSKLLRNNSFYSALRETEENEIYAYFSDLERELLIYDFDWHPNKTLYCQTSYEDNAVQAVLGNSIDSIQLLDGKYYKCVRNHAGELSLIRGIGDIRGFFISTFDLPTDGSQYALLSFYIDDMLVYSISDLTLNNTIVNDNSTWSTLSYVYGADEYGNTAIINASTEFHFFDGDSIYNEKTYKKVFSYRDELHSERFFAGLIREENKETYFVPYHIGLETLLEESILYDFTLEQDEAFEYVMGSGDYSETITLYVLQSDFMLINNVQKKRLIITLQGAPEIVIDTIVENVGSLHGLLYPICYMCDGAFNELLCYTHNGELLYQNPKRSKCYYDNPNELSFVQPTLMNDYGVYPNPVDDILTVFSSNNAISKIDIFNVSGEKIHSQIYKNNIDVSSLAKGLYILKVYDINEQVDIFKFIKK